MGTMQKNNTRRLTESAIMVALAAVLAMVKVWEMPLGGSVTAACMAPIIFIALRYGAKWGLFTGLVFAVIQMIEGFWAPPVRTLLWFFLVVMLDYVLPFGLLGLAPLVARRFKNAVVGAGVATVVVCVIRFLCHFLSGIIIWHTGDPAVPDWVWSLTYNGTFMIPETIINALAVAALVKFVKLPKANG